jgi:transposase, IS30 family
MPCSWTWTERELLHVALKAEPTSSWAALGRLVGRDPTVVMREVGRNGGREGYSAIGAEVRAVLMRGRPRQNRLCASPRTARWVAGQLQGGKSPAGVAAMMRNGPPKGLAVDGWPSITVGTGTIYAAVYSSELGVDPTKVLRRRHAKRLRRKVLCPNISSSPLGDCLSIEHRPVHIAQRVEHGHWEGDLIIGQRNKTAVITLVEMITKTVIIIRLGAHYSARLVSQALERWVQNTPVAMCKSLTWDRGSEMAEWPLLTLGYGLPVYFCHPHAPWERGQNENTNGLIRFWLPKGTCLNVSQQRLDWIAEAINTNPRRSLGWQSPRHVYDALTVL